MDKLIADIAAYCAARGITEGTFGRYAVNDGKLVERLRSGGEVLPRTERQIRRFIDENPPIARGATAA